MRMLTGRRLVAGTCFSLFSLGVCTAPALAQSIHDGKLTGTITSEDRAVMPGATVEISSPSQMGGTRTATTSTNGTYVFLNLPPDDTR